MDYENGTTNNEPEVDIEGFNQFFGITSTDTDTGAASSTAGQNGDEGNPVGTDTADNIAIDTTGQDNQTQDNNTSSSSNNSNAASTSDKQAVAFAQMRIETARQKKLINNIAQVLGITDVSDDKAVMNAVNNAVIKAQSAKQGIPTEVMQRLHTLEERDQEYTRQQAYITAGQGFQKIKNDYGLDNQALNAFADELIAAGINPYEQVVDVYTEYRLRHYDDIIKAAEERGRLQEMERANKANTNASTPNQQKGAANEGNPPQINTIEGLNEFLEKHKK
jgi:hypothetical protein